MKIIKNILILLVFGLFLNFAYPALAVDSSAQSALNGLKNTASKVGAYQQQASDGRDARSIVLERVGGLVGLALSFVGVIFLILIIYAGIQWMTAQGNSGQIDKAKDLMINAAIGLVIVSAAYSITIFIGNQFTQ